MFETASEGALPLCQVFPEQAVHLTSDLEEPLPSSGERAKE